jgi:endoglucanase
MKINRKKIFIILGAIVFIMQSILVSPVFAQTWRVDDSGNITRDGQYFQIRGGSWFGLEGRHEPSNDPNNPSGAPMEMYIGNVWWQPSSRTYDGDAQEFAQMGLNTVRIPLVHQTLDSNDPQGREPYLKNDSSVVIENARLALETVIQVCDDAGLYVILDIHSCNNWVGWRAGRIDDYPPWVDRDRNNYDFTREDYACDGSGDEGDAYNQSVWTQDLRELAQLGQSIGCDNVMGIEIFNEPYDYSWSEWSSLIDTAYNAINSVNSNILVFAGGIGSFNNKHSSNAETPNGDPALNPNWGENLYEAGDDPPSIPKERLVYCPHTYGPSVYVQMQFMDPAQSECEGMEGDEAGDMQCNIVIDPDYISQGWEEHFGYLKDLGYAISINEWGGNMTWPDGAPERMQDRWGWLPDHTIDEQWQNALVDYLISRGICDSCYWSINPESGDTGGLYEHAYDPYNNTGGWGTWEGTDSTKLSLLNRYWDDCDPGSSVTPPPTATNPPTSGDNGDANGDGNISITDALIVAQYYVGLDPANFIAGNADVNCDGNITITDALLIAQYYVNLIDSLDC